MSDNLHRYRAIRHALKQAYPAQPQANLARHLNTLAALISGIVGSKSTQLPNIAAKVPHGTKPDSRVKRFARWFDNDRLLEEVYFFYPMQRCCFVISPCRQGCSSWMAAAWAAGAPP
jgi:hypothetical protein